MAKKKKPPKWTHLTIVANDGEVVTFGPKQWDDYTVALSAHVPCAIVKHYGAWVGIFPLANVKRVVME